MDSHPNLPTWSLEEEETNTQKYTDQIHPKYLLGIQTKYTRSICYLLGPVYENNKLLDSFTVDYLIGVILSQTVFLCDIEQCFGKHIFVSVT